MPGLHLRIPSPRQQDMMVLQCAKPHSPAMAGHSSATKESLALQLRWLPMRGLIMCHSQKDLGCATIFIHLTIDPRLHAQHACVPLYSSPTLNPESNAAAVNALPDHKKDCHAGGHV